MNKLISLSNKLSNIGIDDTLPYLEQKKIKVLNQGIIIGSLFQFLMAMTYVLSLDISSLTICLIINLFLLFLLFLNHKKNYKTSHFLVNSIFPFIMLIIGLLFGRASGIQYNLIIFITTAFFFHRTTIVKFSFSVYNIGIYFFLQYYWHNFDSVFASNVPYWTESIIFLSSVSITVTIIFSFLKENEKYDIKHQELLHSLAQNNKELKTANEELERFAYIASHDLKTPLRTISGYTELIERDLRKNKTDNLLNYFNQIKQGTLQMNDLIKTTLEYSRINNLEVVKGWIDLNSTIKTISNNYTNNKNITIVYKDLPKIFGEENQILSLFQNLIENGIKYNNQSIKKIEISCEINADKYLFLIKDNGIGIEKKYHDQIFTMFKRLHTNQQYEGTGLGLAICEKVVAKMNGKIWMESEVGVGTTFFFKLPIEQNFDELNLEIKPQEIIK